MWGTPETVEKLRRHFGVKSEGEVRDALGVDVEWVCADYAGPPRADLGEGTTASYWGFVTRRTRYDGGSYDEFCHHPLAGAEKWIGVGESSVFERAWALVGFQEFLEGMLVRPEVTARIMERINDFYIEQTLRTLRACGGRADMVYIADDVGTQSGMLLAPTVWREAIKPLQRKLNEAVRAEFPDVVFHYHSCGSIVPIIDDLIEIGVDVLNPLQPKAAGMQAEAIAERWGERLCFCGGLDIQEILPRGSAEEVRQECARLIRTLGRGGGYILAPAHAIQVDVPVENVVAIVEAAQRTPPPELGES
jgi:uroporphyrinogen decarboxylase